MRLVCNMQWILRKLFNEFVPSDYYQVLFEHLLIKFLRLYCSAITIIKFSRLSAFCSWVICKSIWIVNEAEWVSCWYTFFIVEEISQYLEADESIGNFIVQWDIFQDLEMCNCLSSASLLVNIIQYGTKVRQSHVSAYIKISNSLIYHCRHRIKY